MQSATAEVAGPRIEIHCGPDGAQITQNRPAVTALLLHQPVDIALQRVPALLPVCGRAQAVAAGRAIASARDLPPDPDRQCLETRQLLREQALAAAWRCSVDWPDLLGEPRQLATLKKIRGLAADEELGTALLALAPGLEEVCHLEALLEWVQRSEHAAARLARRAGCIGSGPGEVAAPASSDSGSLLGIAGAAFAAEPFDALKPVGGPREVGPRWLARDPLIAELGAGSANATQARILAQLLDTRFIARALRSPALQETSRDPAAESESGMGLGCATTSRGPVFHRVRLEGDTAVDWRVLAPTDWHFAPDGPLAGELAALWRGAGQGPELAAAMRLVIGSHDPCAPWSLQLPVREA